jgi:hypothetical protein
MNVLPHRLQLSQQQSLALCAAAKGRATSTPLVNILIYLCRPPFTHPCTITKQKALKAAAAAEEARAKAEYRAMHLAKALRAADEAAAAAGK